MNINTPAEAIAWLKTVRHFNCGSVISIIEAALSREAALREELETSRTAFKEELEGAKYTRRKFRQERDALQQRLNVAEQLLKRSQEFVAFVHKCVRKNKEYAPLHWQEMVELDRDLSALKPAAEGEGS